MIRYDLSSNIKKRFDGKRFFGTRTYPSITAKESDIIYITNDSDYLDALSYKFYKDTRLWWIIALANHIGNGRLSVEAGLQLRIPTEIDSIISSYNILNK